MLNINKGLQDLSMTLDSSNKHDCIYGIFSVPIQHTEIVTTHADCTYGSNVLPFSYNSHNTGNPVKMPWLCMLCKMCDVRVWYSTNNNDCHSIAGHHNCNCNTNELERILWILLKNVA